MRLIDAEKVGCGMAETWQRVIVGLEVDKTPTIDPETVPIVRQLRAELARVTAERDAAVKDLRGCAIESFAECMYCRYKTARSFCWDCTDGSNWAYCGPRKEATP